MAASVNRVVLVGRSGHDADLRYLPDGEARTRFSLATKRPARAGTEPETDWHQVVCWGRLAELACEHVLKGRLVCVTGRLSYRTYQRDGQTRRVTEVIANEVVLLDRPPAAAEVVAAGGATGDGGDPGDPGVDLPV